MAENKSPNDLYFILTKWPIGLLPGKVQERIARKYDRNRFSYFNAELALSVCTSLVVYGLGQLMENPSYDILRYIDEIATTYVLMGRIAPVGARYIASRILKRPVGSCIVEGANLLKPLKEDLELMVLTGIAERFRNVA